MADTTIMLGAYNGRKSKKKEKFGAKNTINTTKPALEPNKRLNKTR